MDFLKINTEHALGFLSPDDFSSAMQEAIEARSHLLQGDWAGNDFLGWVDLPETIDANELRRLKDEVARLKPMSKVFVVIGIGGSYLGARMVIEALQSEFPTSGGTDNPLIVYAGHTLSEDYYSDLLNFLEHEDYSTVVISKSGTTTEPAVAFRLVKAHMENKYGKAEAARRIVAITDAQRGALHEIASNEGYPMFTIPDNVGGRFSVLTPVGLFPIAMAGYDIDQLLDGARDARRRCLSDVAPEDNPALVYAAVRNALYRSLVNVEMLVTATPNLRYLAEWWKQLFGESEGKKFKGLLPHSMTITTDLHSMGQYVQQGLRVMMETMIKVNSPKTHVAVPFDEANLDGLNYLSGRRLSDINHCALQGTIEAHVSGEVPVVEIEVDRIDEYTLGQLIYFFEFACGVSGYILQVNPFDQPGVEAYKKNMFRLLGKPGF